MILGFCGLKGAGKDTAVKYLVENYGYTRLSFADKLKDSVAALFNISRETVDDFKWFGDPRVVIEWPDNPSKHFADLSWREFLQRYGTEAHREIFGGDFWVDQVLPYIAARESQGWVDVANQKIAISDVRFSEEAGRIRWYRGMVVGIRRPGMEREDSHASERPWELQPEYELLNLEDNMVNLHHALDELMEELDGNAT